MSSNAYSARLTPDRRLRRLVLASGALLGAGGCAAAAVLPVPVSARAGLALVWLLLAGLELVSTARGFGRCTGIRIAADGTVEVRDARDRRIAAELIPGSVVTARFAWLRLAGADGSRFAEPMTGECRKSEEWRRLQVIWRHIGASQ